MYLVENKPFTHILRSLCIIALPISAGRLFHIIANFIAMMMVAQLGKNQLAAAALAISSTITVLTLSSTIFYAIGIRIRYHQGQANTKAAIGSLVKNGFLLAMIAAIPAVLSITYMDRFLLAIGQDPKLIALTHNYFRYAGIGMFPLLAMTVITQFYLGIAKPYVALIIETVNLPLTVFISYAFVLGHFGMPQLGLGGVSLANLLAQSSILMVMLLILYFSKHCRPYRLFSRIFFLDRTICRSILSLGMPIGFQFGGELAAMAFASYLMGYYGVNTLAALQLTNQYSIIIIMLSFGLSQALSLKVSEVYGINKTDHRLIKKYLCAASLLLVLYLIPVSFLFTLFSTQLTEFYMGTNTLHSDFKSITHAFFILALFFLFFDGMRNLLSATLRGLQDSSTATRINLFALWFVSLPLCTVLVTIIHAGPLALRVGFLSGFLLAVLSLGRHMYRKLATPNNEEYLLQETSMIKPGSLST